MLFYEASGKRQRTCDECIRNGGPPPSRLANEFNQKSIITLVKEQKAAHDAAKEGKKSGKGLPPGIQTNKHSRVAAWADWGVIPDTPKIDLSDKDKAAGIFLKFSVYLPVDATFGDTVEVTLPTPEAILKGAKRRGAGKSVEAMFQGLASSVICIVGPDGSVDRSDPDVPKMPVELGLGVDGILFAMPPEQVHRHL